MVMDFIAKMELIEECKLSESSYYKQYKHIERDGVKLSVQASYAHYCQPRVTLDNLLEYDRMEFALIKEGQFVSVAEVCPNFEYMGEIQSHFDGQIYSYVPVHLIEELYQTCFRERYPWEK